MHISRAVFKVSDIFFHPLRNYKRYNGIEIIKNISFGNYGKDTMLDIYFKKDGNNEKMPILVNVHGGGFVQGDKKYRSGIAKYFASHGWFVVNTNYRLAPKANFPAPTEDTINALNFINTLGDKYNIDLSKIVVTGDSAGGYYAAHAVTAICNDALREKLNLPKYTGQKIRGVLTFCAPFNLMKCFTQKVTLNVTVDITNCVFGTKYKDNNIDESFPYKDEPNILKYINNDFPEIFIMAAKNDSLCGGQIDEMLKTLQEKQIKHDYYIGEVKGDSHCSHLLPFMKGTKPCLEKIIDFLETIKRN